MIRSTFVKCADHGARSYRLLSTTAMRSSVSLLGTGKLETPYFHCSSGLRRWYTPMTKEEEEIEKARVSHLTPDEKEAELRKWNREIAKLETLKGINTGELYTWSGRYKALLKQYTFPLLVYYWSTWLCMGGIVYLGIDFGGVDAIALLERIDSNFGWSLSDRVDPQFGKMGVALILNECLEPIRVPFVVATLKPVMDIVSPPKY